MALSLESAGRVKQKTRLYGLNPAVFYTLKGFFLWWATSKGNADLQIVQIDPALSVVADGQDYAIDAACQVYFVYVKKAATGVDAWFRIIDDADNDSEVVGDVKVEAALLESEDIFVGMYPNGLPLADGLVTNFTTTPGDTATESAEADAGTGFIIIGA